MTDEPPPVPTPPTCAAGIVALALVISLLTGCGCSGEECQPSLESRNPYVEFRTRSGLQCVEYGPSGLSCNWDQYNKDHER